MSYAGIASRALTLIRKKGGGVTFTQLQADEDAYDAVRDEPSDFTVSVAGAAVRVKGDPEQYLALGLTESDAATLLFAPTVRGERPPLGASTVFGGGVYTVKSIAPVAPDGVDIICRVICVGGGSRHISQPVLSESDPTLLTTSDDGAVL